MAPTKLVAEKSSIRIESTVKFMRAILTTFATNTALLSTASSVLEDAGEKKVDGQLA